jgi:hypothetical protein
MVWTSLLEQLFGRRHYDAFKAQLYHLIHQLIAEQQLRIPEHLWCFTKDLGKQFHVHPHLSRKFRSGILTGQGMKIGLTYPLYTTRSM